MARLEADPASGLTIPAGTSGTALDELARKAFPGWPEGYRYTEITDGRTRRFGAWRVAGDPVLEALVREHDALAGEYARAVRAGYRHYLRF